MSYLKNILEEEHHRLKALSNKYAGEIQSLPQGSISFKKRGLKKYLYMAYREKGKVRFEYIGPEHSLKSQSVIKKVDIRKQYEDKLKQVNKDLMGLEKVLHGKKI